MTKAKKAEKERLERRQKLANVFKDTLQVNKERKLFNVKTTKLTPNISPFKFLQEFPWWGKKTFVQPNIQVINNDCVAVANELSLKGRTCMLNMANAYHRGGGVRNGAMAQEEELCRRSNLWHALRPSYYPLGETDFIYSKNIKFFKDRNYQIMPEFKCDIITVAAPNLIGVKELPVGYEKLVEKKLKQMLSYPARIGCKNLVLSAFGCGAFKNNPVFMATKFKALLSNLPYENIYFAILDDHNSKANGISNFETFKTILC